MWEARWPGLKWQAGNVMSPSEGMKQVSAAGDALVWATERLVGDKLTQPCPSPVKSLSSTGPADAAYW